MMGNGYLQWDVSREMAASSLRPKYGTNGWAMNFHETFSWREFRGG
jgi:hypothetical protein